jgi:catechol 2,3-dioxygenase-like lactoylglutathione lyase family enzyme
MAVISGDGVFSHVFIGAADLDVSTRFYDATLGALGVKNLGPFGSGWVLYGKDKPAFIIAKPGNGEALGQWRDHRLRRRHTRAG